MLCTVEYHEGGMSKFSHHDSESAAADFVHELLANPGVDFIVVSGAGELWVELATYDRSGRPASGLWDSAETARWREYF